MLLDNEKMSCPISSRFQDRDDSVPHIFGRLGSQAEENHSTRCWQAPAKREFAEVLVERDHQPFFILGLVKKHVVHRTGPVGANPEDIVSGIAQRGHCQPWKIFVGQQLHDGADVR